MWRRKPERAWYRRPLALLLVVPGGLLAFVGVVGFVYLFRNVPLPDELIGQTATTVQYAGGGEIGTLQPEIEREDVPLADLPPHVVNAVLAAEDADYYEHPGVSLPGLFRAAFVNVVSGEVRQGGSTISQQYVKNAILDDNSRTVVRKINEAVLAVKLERQYSKDQILEFYLNSIYFGRGAYGVQAASKAYFDTDADALTPGQAAMLAGFIPAPSSTDPRDGADAEARAADRYRYVLDRLVTEGFMEPAEAGRLQASAMPETIQSDQVRFNQAPFFMQMVEEELKGLTSELGTEGVYSGLTVTTTLDPELQQIAEDGYREGFAETFAAEEGPTGALVTLSPDTGGVVALVGGEDFNADQFNLAKASRQPGSTFKPFALAAWVEQGKSPESYFDAPADLVLEGADAGRDWELSNYEGAAYEGLTLREATYKSVNTVYAQVAVDVGFPAIAEIGTRAGIHEGLEPFPSLVLGSVGVTPLELAEAYNTFAANGVHRDAHTIVEVRRGDDVLYTRSQEGEQVIDADVSATVTNVLEGVVDSGTGTSASLGSGIPVAGKTGTTDDYRDAWFAGYTPELTTVVWMGNRDDNLPMDGEPTGGGVPSEVWADVMGPAHEGMDDIASFPPMPDDLIVTRAAPPETPTCGSGEVLVEATEDGEEDECVDRSTPSPTPEADPTPSPTESAEPTPASTPSPTPPAQETEAPAVAPPPEETEPPEEEPAPRATPPPDPQPSAPPTQEPPAEEEPPPAQEPPPTQEPVSTEPPTRAVPRNEQPVPPPPGAGGSGGEVGDAGQGDEQASGPDAS